MAFIKMKKLKLFTFLYDQSCLLFVESLTIKKYCNSQFFNAYVCDTL